MDGFRKDSPKPFAGGGAAAVPLIFAAGLLLAALFLGVYELDPPGSPLRPFLDGVPLYPVVFWVFMGFSALCVLLMQKTGRKKARELYAQKQTLEKTVALLEEVTGFYQSSSVISAHKNDSLLADLIARESLKCLRAHRAVLFLRGEESREPRAEGAFFADPAYESAGLEQERECARRAIAQGRAFLLREPRDFADVFPGGGKNRGPSSLVSVPLLSTGRTLGALSVSLLEGERRFNEKDLECLSLFSRHAAAAMQNAGEAAGADLNRALDRELDEIAAGLRLLSREEQKGILGELQSRLSRKEAGVCAGPFSGQAAPGFEPGGGKKEETVMYLCPEDESMEFSEDFGEGGLFIRTPNPLELGERFLLRLHNGKREEPIEVTCKVIWTNRYGKESKHLSRGMGVKFLDLKQEDRRRLREYLAASFAVPEPSA